MNELAATIERHRRTVQRPSHDRLKYDSTHSGRAGFNGRIHTRNIPDRHSAFAAELDYREDVSAAFATQSGVKVRLERWADNLPAWIREKADLLEIGLTFDTDRPEAPDRHRLRARRQAADLTQAEVADHLGVHPSKVSDYEQGTRALVPTRATRIGDVIGQMAATDGGGKGD